MLAELRQGEPVTDLADARARARHMAGTYFVRGLEHCGVFGSDSVDGCQRFLADL